MNFQKNHEEDTGFQKIQTPNQNEPSQNKKDGGMSNQTRDKVEAAKSYIESLSLFKQFCYIIVLFLK